MQKFLGALAGIVILFALVIAFGWIATTQHPVPQVATPDAAARAAWLASAPLAAQLAWLAGGLLGAFAGAFAALRIAGSATPAWIVAAFGVLLALPSFLLFAQPWWLQAATIAAPLLGGWLATRLAAAPIATPVEP